VEIKARRAVNTAKVGSQAKPTTKTDFSGGGGMVSTGTALLAGR